MKRIIRKSAAALIGLLAIAYFVVVVMRAVSDEPIENRTVDTSLHSTIAIFGATGTIGDGLLKAAMNDAGTSTIHIVTRRPSPRIEEGVASGKVVMTIHMDYQDFSEIAEILAEVDAVY